MADSTLGVVVIISGNGSNLQALIDYQHQPECRYRIVKVISNRSNAYGLERAKQHHITTEVVDHTQFPDRETFEQALINSIDEEQPGLVVLAGFMRILTPLFTDHYLGRMLNIHPSLLPKYPGLNTHQRALEAGDTEHGLSIHFVTSELDGGPVVMQASVKVDTQDTAESLQQKVHQQEHLAYPLTVNLFAIQQLSFAQGHVFWQGQALLQPLNLADFE